MSSVPAVPYVLWHISFLRALNKFLFDLFTGGFYFHSRLSFLVLFIFKKLFDIFIEEL